MFVFDSAEAEEEATAEEEMAREMTLDEWKAMQTQARAPPVFNIRKPGEGVDGGQWKRTFVLPKKKTETGETDEEDSEEEVRNETSLAGCVRVLFHHSLGLLLCKKDPLTNYR